MGRELVAVGPILETPTEGAGDLAAVAGLGLAAVTMAAVVVLAAAAGVVVLGVQVHQLAALVVTGAGALDRQMLGLVARAQGALLPC